MEGRWAHAPLKDDISPSADDNGLNLGLLGLGHSELVKRLLEKIIEITEPKLNSRGLTLVKLFKNI